MSRTRVRDIMPDTIVTISEGDRLSTVDDIMTLGHVRHMPVTHGGKLVGVVSATNVEQPQLDPVVVAGDHGWRHVVRLVDRQGLDRRPVLSLELFDLRGEPPDLLGLLGEPLF